MSTCFYKGDCLPLITNHISDTTIDLIYFNPPFATTKNKWDQALDWKLLFEQFYRILKPDGVIVIHCSVPFNYTLIRDAPKPPNYSWYWTKERITNPLLANKQPLRNTEEILVWTNKKVRYYPQKNGNEERTSYTASPSTYYGTIKETVKKTVKGYYQTHHIQMKRLLDGFSTRPIELVELIIKSYTKEGDTILDPTCHKGMCGAIAKGMGRKWIGMDKFYFPEKILLFK